MLAGAARAKVHLDASHRDGVLSILSAVVPIKLDDEKACAFTVASPKARSGCFGCDLSDVEVRAGHADLIPRR